jgi:hypothetical protein
MNCFYTDGLRHGWRALLIVTLVGCSPTQFTTLTIYETPQSFVRLEVDRTLEHGAGHSHPSDISPEQMATVLRGISIQEPLTRLPFYDDLSVPRRHPAFSESDIAFWAPLLSQALSKATAAELATFYQSTKRSGTTREVTSGGLFVHGKELHLVLSNLQSETHHTADIGFADTQDDRLTPMRSLAPQRGRLLFVPESALVPRSPEGLSRLFQEDRRELVVLYQTLRPQRTDSDPENAEQSPDSPQPR